MTVENTGKSSVFRVRGRSASATAAFDGLDFPIGHIPAGETRRFTQTVRTSRSMPSELVDITTTVYVGERQKPANTEAVATLQVTGLDRPRFGYTVHVLDHEGGNGDGRISKDESVTLRLRITNVGLGKAHKTLAALKNRGSEAVFVTHGREWIKELEPGKASVVDFKLQVRGDLPVSGLKLDLQVTDTVLRQRMTHALQLPTTTTPFGTLVRRPSQWVVDKATPYLDSASASARNWAKCRRPKLFSDARVGDWLRIPVNLGTMCGFRGRPDRSSPGVKVPQKDGGTTTSDNSA